MSRSATAVAHPNIALVKYWGKRDESLVLPHQSSLSVTLAPLEVTTTVEWGAEEDSVTLDGLEAKASERARVLALLAQVKSQLGVDLGAARVTSKGNFPKGAGLASSAAGFAALAVAALQASGCSWTKAQASQLARRGSGSAARSIEGGFCVWSRGERADGEDSVARQVFPSSHWPSLRMVAALVSRDEKEVGSRDGMKHTVETSPYYPAWAQDAEAELPKALALVERRDLEGLGALAERNAWRMHATALAADPPLCYLLPKTLELILAARAARQQGLPVWFTLDAGPNPVLLTDAQNVERVEAMVREHGVADVVRCSPGDDARAR